MCRLCGNKVLRLYIGTPSKFCSCILFLYITIIMKITAAHHLAYIVVVLLCHFCIGIGGTTLIDQLKQTGPNQIRSLVNNKTYVISSTKATQDEALLECASNFGGQLATILNAEEHDAVVKAIIDSNSRAENLWTAGRQVPGTYYDYYWLTTNEDVTSQQLQWYYGYPKGYKDAGLAYFVNGWTMVTGYTDDNNFGAAKRFICEV